MSSIREEKSRMAHWDNIKFVMITLMVIGHFADEVIYQSDACKSIYLLIYAFHMPVFLFISGLFFTTKHLREKVIYYISGGFAVKIFLSTVRLFIHQKADFSLLSDGGIPWFFFVIAIYQVLMYLLRNVNKTYLLVGSVILACFAGYDKTIGDYLYLSRAIVFFPFFILGSMLTPEKVDCTIKKFYKTLAPLAVICMAAWFCLCFFKLDAFYIYRHLFTGRNPFSDVVVAYGPLARLLCYMITFLTGASVMVLIPQKRIPFFTSLGAHTENVYFWHMGLYYLLYKYCSLADLFTMSYGGKICFFLLAIGVSIVLSSVGFFNYPLQFIRKLCYGTPMRTSCNKAHI